MKATPPTPAPRPSPHRRRRTEFTIFGLMVLMFVASLGFALLSYLVRSDQGDTSAWPVATLMAVALPMLVMTIASLGYSIAKWLKKRR